jgi:hypothetical protein
VTSASRLWPLPKPATSPRRSSALSELPGTCAGSRNGWSAPLTRRRLTASAFAVASLSGQQPRAAEVRAKLGGVGGYAAPRSDKSDAAPFVLNIQFSGGRTTRIEGVPIHPDDPAFNAIPAVPLSIGSASGSASAHGANDEEDDGADFDEDV